MTLTKEQAGYLAGVLQAYIASNQIHMHPEQLKQANQLIKDLLVASR